MWLNTDKRRLLMKSITGGKPVRADTINDIIIMVVCERGCVLVRVYDISS